MPEKICMPPKFTKGEELAPLLENKKILLFDFDGTMADTEPFHWKAYDMLLSEMGISLSEDHIRRYIGHSEVAIYEMIREDFGVDFRVEVFAEKRLKKYLELVKKENLKPYNFIEYIMEHSGEAKVIVSSQMPHIVDALIKMWGYEAYFPKDHIFCCHDGRFTKKKVYENIFSLLGVPQGDGGQVILFEDATHYIREGASLGMTVVGIEHFYNRGTLSGCHAIVSTPSATKANL